MALAGWIAGVQAEERVPLPELLPSRPFLRHERPVYRNYAFQNFANYPNHSSPYTDQARAYYSSMELPHYRLFALRVERDALARAAGREAARFVRENGNRPFVLYAGFMDPHSPLPSRPSSLYDPAKLPREPHFLRRPPANASLYHQKKAEFYGNLPEIDGEDLRDESGWLRLRTRYWEAVSSVDRAMAPILEALGESGAADNTIVVFTSDHGEMMGSHGMLHKEVLYQVDQGAAIDAGAVDYR